MYLCVIIDLWNRQVVGWSVRNDMTAHIVIDAFQMAILRYGGTEGSLFHSDRSISVLLFGIQVSHCSFRKNHSSEHEQKGQLLGQCLCRIFL